MIKVFQDTETLMTAVADFVALDSRQVDRASLRGVGWLAGWGVISTASRSIQHPPRDEQTADHRQEASGSQHMREPLGQETVTLVGAPIRGVLSSSTLCFAAKIPLNNGLKSNRMKVHHNSIRWRKQYE